MIDIKKMFTKILTNLNTLNNKVTRQALFADYEFKGTKSNEWEYIGKSFTVPSGHVYLTRIYTNYVSGKPIGLGVHTTSTLSGTGIPQYGSIESANGVQITPTFLLTAATYYIYVKRATVPSAVNKYSVYIVDITG